MSTADLDGRGTRLNPANRYEPLHIERALEDDADLGAPPAPTELFRDASRSILAENDSPDIPFRFSLNPYRGCEHGCVYCYARPSHGDAELKIGTRTPSRVADLEVSAGH